jgi:hypothetical protein
MRPRTNTLIEYHGAILMTCSLTGVIGFYLQHGFLQPTAFIPSTIGVLLILITRIRFRNENLKFALLFLITLTFGIILTRMSIKFIPQDFQPLRKRIYFPIMASSSLVTAYLLWKNFRAEQCKNSIK